jgi:hypothetical protein
MELLLQSTDSLLWVELLTREDIDVEITLLGEDMDADMALSKEDKPGNALLPTLIFNHLRG